MHQFDTTYSEGSSRQPPQTHNVVFSVAADWTWRKGSSNWGSTCHRSVLRDSITYRGKFLFCRWLEMDRPRYISVSRVGNTVDSAVNRTVDRTVDSAVNRTVDRTVDSTVDSAVDRTVDSTVGSTVDRTVGSTVDRTVDSTVDRTVDSTLDRTVDSTVESTVAVERSLSTNKIHLSGNCRCVYTTCSPKFCGSNWIITMKITHFH